MSRRRNSFCIRAGLIFFLALFVFLQMQFINNSDFHDAHTIEATNYSNAAILSMVPPVFHKYLTSKSRNLSTGVNSSSNSLGGGELIRIPNITEIKRQIIKYNEAQTIINEEIYGPLQNDSVIIVVQVHKRITYLRHLIVSLAQAKDISRAMLIFSHDFYDEDINDLVQSIDFCKVMQIFYPYSIQTHPHEFPGADPDDCPRDMKKEQAIKRNCNNALHPDLYGHYREAGFTQTKHHWWWKANRVFDQLDCTRYHTGLVLFLEEDHYVAEDFIYLLELMQKKSHELCPKCNILSLGTYLKTFNYYTYSNKKNNNKKAYFGQSYQASASNSLMGLNNFNYYNTNYGSSGISSSSGSNNYMSNMNNNNNNINNHNNHNYINSNHNTKNIAVNNNQFSNINNALLPLSSLSSSSLSNANGGYHHQNNKQNTNHNVDGTTNDKNSAPTWGYQVLPSLYSIYQKVEVTPWISSKHNMGMAINRTTFHEIVRCAEHFCNYDDYNWDWSLQHVSQQCLEQKLYAMVVKGPRVFHIGECGVHHKKNNCESNQVISKVQQVIKIATKSGQLYPRSLTLTMASVVKKTKLRKGNGGWGDSRDRGLCLDMTNVGRDNER